VVEEMLGLALHRAEQIQVRNQEIPQCREFPLSGTNRTEAPKASPESKLRIEAKALV
jgi:hypothetical protein